MAGGIDWLRWHHGSTTDPKFALVAKRAGVRTGDAIAVWAHLLEAASQAEERGRFGVIDCEAIDLLFGFDEGDTAAILRAMEGRDLIFDGWIKAWGKRQPKREDDTAAERKRRQREREKAVEVTPSVTPEDDVSRNVTHGHDRGEESREDKDLSPSLRSGEARKRATPPARPDGVDESTWRDWLALRKAKKAPVTETVLREAEREAGKAALPLTRFLEIWCARGSQGLQAEWLRPDERARAGPAGPQSRTRSAVETALATLIPEAPNGHSDLAPQRTGEGHRRLALPATG